MASKKYKKRLVYLELLLEREFPPQYAFGARGYDDYSDITMFERDTMKPLCTVDCNQPAGIILYVIPHFWDWIKKHRPSESK